MPDEIITRTVRITEPVEAEITVTINVSAIARQAAIYAFTNAHGKTAGKVSMPTPAVCNREALLARNALLKLKNLKRDCFGSYQKRTSADLDIVIDGTSLNAEYEEQMDLREIAAADRHAKLVAALVALDALTVP